MKITHYEERCFYSRPSVSTSLCSLLQPCTNEEQVCVCLASTMPCPAHIAKFSSCESHHQSQTSHCRFCHSELLIRRNLRMLHWGCGVIQSNHILWWLPKSTNMCAARQCHHEARFLLYSGDAEFIWNNSWILSVSWCMNWSWLSPTETSHSQESHLHSARREWSWPHLVTETFSIFFALGEWGWCHSTDCVSDPSPKWWIQVSSVVIGQVQKMPITPNK